MSKSEMEAALIKAAEFDKYYLAKCLLKNGVNVSAENEKGIPSIIYAAGKVIIYKSHGEPFLWNRI
jgi:hypothetical protein